MTFPDPGAVTRAVRTAGPPGFGINPRTGGAGVFEMCIDVVDMYDQTARHVGDEPGGESVLRGGAVQPDGGVADTDFTMNGVSLGASEDTAGLETERRHQEIVSGLDVFVDEKRDDALELRGMKAS